MLLIGFCEVVLLEFELGFIKLIFSLLLVLLLFIIGRVMFGSILIDSTVDTLAIVDEFGIVVEPSLDTGAIILPLVDIEVGEVIDAIGGVITDDCVKDIVCCGEIESGGETEAVVAGIVDCSCKGAIAATGIVPFDVGGCGDACWWCWRCWWW